MDKSFTRPKISLNQQMEYNLNVPYFSNNIRTIQLNRRKGVTSFGFSIRGGREHGIGVYVSDVDEGSEAKRQGLRIGDQIIYINGLSIDQAIHQEVLNLILKSRGPLVLKVKSIGMIPIKNSPTETLSWQIVMADGSNGLQKTESGNNSPSGDVHDVKVFLKVKPNQKFGCNICKGPVDRPGIYIQYTTEGGLAREVGLRAGDKILEANGKNLQNMEFQEAVEYLKKCKQVELIVRRGEGADLFPVESSGYSSSSSINEDSHPAEIIRPPLPELIEVKDEESKESEVKEETSDLDSSFRSTKHNGITNSNDNLSTKEDSIVLTNNGPSEVKSTADHSRTPSLSPSSMMIIPGPDPEELERQRLKRLQLQKQREEQTRRRLAMEEERRFSLEYEIRREDEMIEEKLIDQVAETNRKSNLLLMQRLGGSSGMIAENQQNGDLTEVKERMRNGSIADSLNMRDNVYDTSRRWSQDFDSGTAETDGIALRRKGSSDYLSFENEHDMEKKAQQAHVIEEFRHTHQKLFELALKDDDRSTNEELFSSGTQKNRVEETSLDQSQNYAPIKPPSPRTPALSNAKPAVSLLIEEKALNEAIKRLKQREPSTQMNMAYNNNASVVNNTENVVRYRPPPIAIVPKTPLHNDMSWNITDSTPSVPRPPDFFFPTSATKPRVIIGAYEDQARQTPKRLEYLKQHPSVEVEVASGKGAQNSPLFLTRKLAFGSKLSVVTEQSPVPSPVLLRKTPPAAIAATPFVTKITLNGANTAVNGHQTETDKVEPTPRNYNPPPVVKEPEPEIEVPFTKSKFNAVRALFDKPIQLQPSENGLLSPTYQKNGLKFQINIQDKQTPWMNGGLSKK